MNQNFLDYYQQELKFFRDSAKEFAHEYPQVAQRLGLAAPEIEDPYVERLIEAVSFLTARINLKVDAEYPNFLQHIFKVVQPEFTQPIPTAGVVELTPTVKTLIPKYSQITTFAKKKNDPVCTFSTCHDVLLLPIELNKVSYTNSNSSVVKTNFFNQNHKSLLSFTLMIPYQLKLQADDFGQLRFFMQGDDLYSNVELLYLIKTKCVGLQLSVAGSNWKKDLIPDIELCGFEEYLSIHNDRNVTHLKHLLEYSVLPQKYLFFKIRNLGDALSDSSMPISASVDSQSSFYNITVTLFFSELSNNLAQTVDENMLSIHSVMINNVFKKRTRFIIDTHKNEQHIVLDKLRPQDYEVVRIAGIEGFSNTNHSIKVFEPLYKLAQHNADLKDSYGFFSEIHKKTNTAKAGSYKGNECYIMLNNQLKHIMDDDLTQLSVDLWASNRNLPSEISWTLDQDLHLNDESFKVSKIKRQMSFTQPIDIPTETVSTWRLMNLFSSNFIPIDLHDSQVLTQQIKNNLYVIYEITRNEAFKSQINAITHIEAKRTSQVQRVEGRLAAVTGLHFIITLDELMMSHTHPYLWGCILAIYLTGFTPLNHYLALTLKNKRGDVIATYNSLNG